MTTIIRHMLSVAAVLVMALPSVSAASLLVEAERFDNKRGWSVDQQFMDLMGSPYLIAHGMGEPVKDAVTEVTFPEPGRYYAYVRTYNWTAPWHDGRGPGRFSLAVNGRTIGKDLGADGKEWGWQYAGTVNIRSLRATVALKDATGFDGRCDAVYFTTEADDKPAGDATGLQKLRDIKPAEDAGEFDLVVVGGGIAGMSAAVSAARLGCRVALINDRRVLGGNNSSEIRVHLGGAIDIGRYPAVGGLQKEFGPSREGNAQPAEYYEDQKKMDWIASEPDVTAFLGYRVNEVDVADGRIRSVTGTDIETGKRLRFSSGLFADCTGDGTVGYLAGADYLYGRESRDEYGEPTAPEKNDRMTMGVSIQWRSREAHSRKDARFPVFEYGLGLDDESCRRVDMGEWTWETGMNYDQINDAERIRDYGMLVVYSNWSYLKNRLGLFPDRRLDWVAYVAGKRESRRLLGDYILKEDDMTKHVFHEDGSFTATWSIDLHCPDPENTAHFPGEEFIATTNHVVIYPYPVPYRCLYSRNVDNLFMAGRDISVTHVALGSVRVMRTTGMMGEVVGMAASLCKRHGVEPRGVYRYHLPELKALMEKGVAVPGLPNNQQYNEGGRLSRIPVIQ